jgi:sigma-E factor negative regulatory protein RseC
VSHDAHTVEGIARVVKIADGIAWFEPEQTTSCGHCASSAACGMGGSAATGSGTGIGSIARRIELRRFPLAAADGLRVGDRVVVGVGDSALLKASATAYVLPLVAALAIGGIAQAMAGNDAVTMAAMVAGLVAGLFIARIAARRLGARGDLSPKFLRYAAPGETCHPNPS